MDYSSLMMVNMMFIRINILSTRNKSQRQQGEEMGDSREELVKVRETDQSMIRRQPHCQ